MNNRLLLIIILILFSTSCKTTWYQVSSLKSNDNIKNFEIANEDLTLEYNFWSEGGTLRFSITNNNIKPVFIDWQNSKFIFNGLSYNYFVDTETIRSLGVYQGKSIKGVMDIDNEFNSLSSISVEKSSSAISTISVATKEQKVILIPPKARINSKEIKLDFPWIKTKEDQIVLNNNNTPLKIRTYIAYSMDKELKKLEYIDNEFWINNIDLIHKKKLKEEISNNSFYTKGEKFDPIFTGISVGFFVLAITLFVTTQ